MVVTNVSQEGFDGNETKNPYFLDYDSAPGKKMVGSRYVFIWSFIMKKLKDIWPYIYRIINILVFDSLRIFKIGIKMAIRQITQFKGD